MGVKKDTNPKDVLGIKKVPISTVPTGPLFEVGLAMLEGARKYGRHNYRVIGVRGSVYYDAVIRHLGAWYEGEDIDPDSGLNHIVKAIASLFVLRDSMLMENWVDDRPPKYEKGLDLTELNKLAEKIIEKYPECEKPFCEIAIDAETSAKELDTEKLFKCDGADNPCCNDRCSHREPHKFNDALSLCNDPCDYVEGVRCQEIKE